HGPLEWLEVEDVFRGPPRLLPVEWVHPRVQLQRSPLVLETSSGTAAHVGTEAATLASLCELIERDAFLIFWHRQPVTSILPVDRLPSELRQELFAAAALGFVITVCALSYDLDIP